MPDQEQNFRTAVTKLYAKMGKTPSEADLDDIESRYAGKEREAIRKLYGKMGKTPSEADIEDIATRYNFDKKKVQTTSEDLETGAEEPTTTSEDSDLASLLGATQLTPEEEASSKEPTKSQLNQLWQHSPAAESTGVEKPMAQKIAEGEVVQMSEEEKE